MENEMILTFDCISNTKFNSGKEAIDELCRKIQENYEKNSSKGFITEQELLEGTFLAKEYPDFGWAIGVFTSKELAEKCVAENTKKDSHYVSYDLVPKIMEVERDKTFPLVKADDPYETAYRNNHYIGGYIE